MPVYNPYNYNPYQELKTMRDRIDNTMQQYQQQQNQFQNQMIPQQPQIHQNFQLGPVQTNSDLESKFVNNIDDVKNTFVMREGIFVNREMNTLWTKNVSGDIKTYSLTEIIEKDPKDVEINNLKRELENMRTLISQQISQPKLDNQPETKVETKTEKKSK